MPIFDAERFLSETLGSIQEQTFDDWRLYCHIAGATDKSEKIVRNFELDNPNKVQVLVSGFKVAPGISRNILGTIAGGEYFVFWDSDDLHLPESLEQLLEAMPGGVAAHSDVSFIDASAVASRDGRDIRENAARLRVDWSSRANVPGHIRRASRKAPIRLGGSMVSREAFLAVGGFWAFEGGEDYSFWYKISLFGRINHVPHALFKKRIHSSNLSGSPRRSVGNLRVMLLLGRLEMAGFKSNWRLLVLLAKGMIGILSKAHSSSSRDMYGHN